MKNLKMYIERLTEPEYGKKVKRKNPKFPKRIEAEKKPNEKRPDKNKR